MASERMLLRFIHKGIHLPYICTAEHQTYVEEEFQMMDDDVVNLTYPKSGTHWMSEILSLTWRDGDPTWIRSVRLSERVPWIEDAGTKDMVLNCARPRLLCSHLPFQLFPKSFLHSKAKIIYTARNPKDVLVSFYHFSRAYKKYQDQTFQEAFEEFLSGKMIFGSWFDHVKGWLALKDKPNFFLNTYEEMQQDAHGSVERICRFLGKTLTSQQIDSVVKNSSFEIMKDNKMSNMTYVPFMDQSKAKLMRKGKCGTWKSTLTVAQSEQFDRVYEAERKAEHLTYVEEEFQMMDDDVVNVTYPKSGTHWMAETLSLIWRDGDPTWTRSVFLPERVPGIENAMTKDIALNCARPRLLCSHLPFQLFPKSFLHSKAKIIYTARNPKDVLVSSYYFSKALKNCKDQTFQEAFENFLSGKKAYGSWFDHVKGWLALKDKPNFFLNTYEEMQQDPHGSVERICRFLGKTLTSQQIDSVVKNSSFEIMKDNEMSNFTQIPDTVIDHSKGKLMRIGKCCTWKSSLTVAQSEQFDQVYQEEMRGVSVTFPWD